MTWLRLKKVIWSDYIWSFCRPVYLNRWPRAIAGSSFQLQFKNIRSLTLTADQIFTDGHNFVNQPVREANIEIYLSSCRKKCHNYHFQKLGVGVIQNSGNVSKMEYSEHYRILFWIATAIPWGIDGINDNADTCDESPSTGPINPDYFSWKDLTCSNFRQIPIGIKFP